MPRRKFKYSKAQGERLHAEKRAFQRYGVALSRFEVTRLVEDIQKGRVECSFRQSKRVRRIVMHVPRIGKTVPLVYDTKRKEIVTFLPMNEADIIRIQASAPPTMDASEPISTQLLPDEHSSDSIPNMLFCDWIKGRKVKGIPDTPERQIYARAGETVTCENEHAVVDVVTDIHCGEKMDAAVQFGNWRAAAPTRGQFPLPVCEECGAPFCAGLSGLVLHFADGWRVQRY